MDFTACIEVSENSENSSAVLVRIGDAAHSFWLHARQQHNLGLIEMLKATGVNDLKSVCGGRAR